MYSVVFSEREHEFELAKQGCFNDVSQMIDQNSFPLNTDQLSARLDRFRLADIADIRNVADDSFIIASGVVLPKDGLVYIHPWQYDEQDCFRLHTIRHELWHVISQIDSDTPIGLIDTLGAELDLDASDEALTEMLTAASLSEEADIDFGSSDPADWVKLYIATMSSPEKDAYQTEVQVLTNSMLGIPLGVVTSAYTKKDNDPHDTDKQAGGHAAAKFRESLVKLGGEERIIKLGQIASYLNDTYSKDHEEEPLEAAYQLACEIALHDVDFALD